MEQVALMPHQKRMVTERNQLKDKITKLADFIGHNKLFLTLNGTQKELLREQCECMCEYLEALESRIKAEVAGDIDELTVHIDFGDAVRAMKDGKRVARAGWNGSGMYAVLMNGYPDGVPANKETAIKHGIEEGENIKFRPYYALFTAQKDIATWAPSGSDTLAEDWFIVE
ncbi:protein of unknown function DUF2829 [Vibrio phage 1.205.O._10N.222.51.A7]|nr:protein of unknown function DUF2829 [Vibrio phage 1.205.O._10N.222.51.A7]